MTVEEGHTEHACYY